MTSTSAPGNQTDSACADPASSASSTSPQPSESEYLRQQRTEAKAAIAVAFSELKADLAKGVDPRVWIKTHPWITLASAAAAGFAAAASAIPSKDDRALRRLGAIERALGGSPDRKEHGNGNGNGNAPAAGSGLIGMLLKELVGAVKPILITLITEGARGNSKPESPKSETSAP